MLNALFPRFGAQGVASDDGSHTGAFYTLYPYRLDREGDDRGVLLAWAWGAIRGVDALQYLSSHDPEYAKLLDLKKLVVTGFSRWGKAALLAGFLDDRFQVTAPGGSGSGGAAPYRYDSFGNRPFRTPPFGNMYPWGRSIGAETLGVPQNLALDIYVGGGGHSLKPAQAVNIVHFADRVLFGKPLAEDARTHLTTDPYLNAGTYERYYDGLQTMMPWAGAIHVQTHGEQARPQKRADFHAQARVRTA